MQPASPERLRGVAADISAKKRIERLIALYPGVWGQVEADLRRFIAWLEMLADQLSAS